MQEVPDDDKEIQQPTLRQCVANGHATVAFADGFVLHVRMGNAFVRRCGLGIQRDHAVVARMTVDQVAPVQPDLELAQVNAFQFNGLGLGRQCLPRMVPRDFIELIVQGQYVVIDVLNRSEWPIVGEVGVKLLCYAIKFAMEAADHGPGRGRA